MASNEIIELGLTKSNHAIALSGLIDRLIGILVEAAVESDSLKTGEFKTKLGVYRRRLTEAPEGREFGRYASECLQLCDDYYTRSQTYLLDRESEFAEVIRVLREALGRLSGEANNFNERLMGASDRFNRLTEIEDLRELKKRVSQEVHELRRVVDEKKKQDEASYTRLNRRVEVLQHSLEKTKAEASLDALTSVANRGSFDRALPQWIAKHAQTGTPFSLAMMDIDNFKKINDSHGHQIGDRVLLCAAQCFGKSIRANDFLARYGGEEFVILARGLGADQAVQRFTEMLARIAGASYEYTVGETRSIVHFTVSCGVAQFVPGERGEDLLRRADEALYTAKRTGKNRVVVAEAANIPEPKKSKGLWNSLKPLIPFRSGTD